jgi:hypothetical protein
MSKTLSRFDALDLRSSSPAALTTASGKVLADDDIAALADETRPSG